MKMYEFRLKFEVCCGGRGVGQINNIQALVQTMAWRQAIIWTNDGYIIDAYMRHLASRS